MSICSLTISVQISTNVSNTEFFAVGNKGVVSEIIFSKKKIIIIKRL